MRLTCPNCSARYEVADSMIPPEGRDVQCSNCSTTWFQPGRRTDREPVVRVDRSARADAEMPTASAETPQPEAETPEAAVSAALEDAASSVDAAMPDTPAEDAPDTSEAPSPMMPRRREIDPEVRDILREEAEREARLRQAEAAPVETQGEMPLAEEADDVHRARRRAELENAEDAFAAGASGPAARDLFPDIDEINSTLRDTGDRSDAETFASDIETLETAPRRRRGTRIGFLLAIAIAAGGAGIYGNVDRLAGILPAAAPVLERYEAAVNSARFWLDDLAQGLGGATDGT